MEINQKTVLIAEENTADNVCLSILLKRLDYAVLTVSNGADVIKKMASFHPDVVVMNLWMPGMDGATCLGHIQKDARLKSIPMVLMSDTSNAKALEDSIKRGAAAYIFKPINPTPLYQVIQKLTEKRPRENLRARIIFKVAVAHQNTKKLSYATILSERGVFIRTVKPIPVGTKVRVSMDLPTEKPIELDGEVIYIVETNKGHFVEPGMCVKFLNIDQNIQRGLRKFVEEQLTYDIDPNLDL